MGLTTQVQYLENLIYVKGVIDGQSWSGDVYNKKGVQNEDSAFVGSLPSAAQEAKRKRHDALAHVSASGTCQVKIHWPMGPSRMADPCIPGKEHFCLTCSLRRRNFPFHSNAKNARQWRARRLQIEMNRSDRRIFGDLETGPHKSVILVLYQEKMRRRVEWSDLGLLMQGVWG